MRTVSLPSEPAVQTESAAQTKIAVSFRALDQAGIGNSGQMAATGSEAEAKIIRTAALKEAVTERQALNDACMLHRGWVKSGG
jgi:hypothetical protein